MGKYIPIISSPLLSISSTHRFIIRGTFCDIELEAIPPGKIDIFSLLITDSKGLLNKPPKKNIII